MFAAQKQFAANLAKTLTQITLEAFFKRFHATFMPDQDISFMDYFLELIEHGGEFYIPHQKLVEYGVMTSTQSSHVLEKLQALGLSKDEDFTLTDVRERGNSGAQTHKRYTLTPEAFKLCLMRAQRRRDQPNDPTIYTRYFLLLERVFKFYSMYELLYAQRLLAIKDGEFGAFREEARQRDEEARQRDEESKRKMDQQSAEIKQQSLEIRTLLGHTMATHAKLDETHVKLDAVQEDLTEARDQIDDLQDDICELKDEVSLTAEQVEIATSYLEEKSFTSTKNPQSDAKHHYFGAMSHSPSDSTQVVTFIAGQKARFDVRIPELEAEGHEVIVPPFYNANPIDLRQNVQSAFLALRKARLIEINAENDRLDKIFNEALKIEIRAYNKANTENKRVFSQEKRKTTRVLVRDIPVKFGAVRFSYTLNEYMRFEEVLQLIMDENKITQRSPLGSFDEEETKSEE